MSQLKKIRIKNGFTQQQIADMVGIDRTAYVRIENGIREPKVALAIKLAEYFHTTVEDLFSN